MQRSHPSQCCMAVTAAHGARHHTRHALQSESHCQLRPAIRACPSSAPPSRSAPSESHDPTCVPRDGGAATKQGAGCVGSRPPRLPRRAHRASSRGAVDSFWKSRMRVSWTQADRSRQVRRGQGVAVIVCKNAGRRSFAFGLC